MSLQVWLPFNGNLKNMGCGEIQVTGGTVQYLDTGKLGKCANLASRVIFYSSALANMTNENFSVAFWVRTDASSTLTGDWVDIMGMQDLNTNKTGTGTFRFEACYSSNLRACSWHDNANDNIISGSITCVPDSEKGKWHHVCVTMSNGSSVTYRDGVNIGTKATVAGGYFNGILHIGETNAIAGGIADLRIYDHALSVAEVKELAKGLVCHYPLASQYDSTLANKYSGAQAEGSCGGSFTKVKLENERGYNYKLTRTGNGVSTWPSMNIGSTYSFTAGKRYYYSCKVRCHKWTSGTFSLRASRSINDWVTSSVVVCSPTLADNQWHEYSVSQIVNETYDRSGTTLPCAPILEFYSSDQKAEGTLFDMDFDVKDLQVVESDTYVPFIQNEFMLSTISDCSGNGYSGTKSGTLTVTSSTPRYDLSTTFSSGSHINTALVTGGFTNTYTFSWWGKYTKYQGHMMWGFSDGNRLNLYMANGGNFYWNTGDGSNNPFGVSAATYGDGNWHHFAVTGDGTTSKLYIDGVFKANATTYRGITGTTLYMNGWDSSTSYNFNGSLSDFRLYATTLSADDIKALYNIGARIAKNGSMLSYEVKEVG